MDDAPQLCPKCQGRLTLLEGGLRYCSKCGFEGEIPKPSPETEKRSAALFWILLIAPAAMALISYSAARFTHGPNGFGVAIGMAGMLIGGIGAIYCGIWIAGRFSRPGASRALLSVVAVLVIGLVNLFMVVAGCAPNIDLR